MKHDDEFSGDVEERRHSCRPESRASAKACLPGRRRQADKNVSAPLVGAGPRWVPSVLSRQKSAQENKILTDSNTADCSPLTHGTPALRSPSSQAAPVPLKRPLRVALVDDDASVHAALRNALQSLAPEWVLESHLKLVEAIQKIRSHPPEAVLMDLWMPEHSGVDCTRRIKGLLPHLPIIMLTACSDANVMHLGLMAEASGYLIKPATPQDVVNAVIEAVNGGNFLCRQAQRTIAASFGRCATDQALHGFLSPREQEILACLFRNLLDKEISEELHISTGTVHSHLVRLFRKLGVHSRKEALQRFLGAS